MAGGAATLRIALPGVSRTTSDRAPVARCLAPDRAQCCRLPRAEHRDAGELRLSQELAGGAFSAILPHVVGVAVAQAVRLRRRKQSPSAPTSGRSMPRHSRTWWLPRTRRWGVARGGVP